jgi:hypothetical protein
VGDTTASTGVSTLVCSLSRAHACRRVHSFGQEGRVSPWRARAHGLFRESRGVRPLGGMCSHLCRRRRRGHGGDTNRRRVHGDDTESSAMSGFRRGGVQGRGGQKGSNLGSMARQTHVRRYVGVRGDGDRQVKQGPGPSVACIRVCAEHRRRDHGGDTKLMACTRQGKKERGMARNGPAVLVRHKCR